MARRMQEVCLYGSELSHAVQPLFAILGTVDRDRIEVLVELAVNEKISLQACLDSLYPDKSVEDAQKALRNFRKRINDLATESKMHLQFVVDTKKRSSPTDRRCWFTGPSPLLQHAENFADDQTREFGNEPSVTSRGIATSLGALEKRKRLVKFFASYAHEDEKLMRSLLDGLKVQFAASKTYGLDVWTDHLIPLGSNWEKSIEAAISECDFGLFLVSPAFLGSKFISEREIPSFLGTGRTAQPKPVFPVAMKRFSFDRHDLRGIDAHQIYLGEDKRNPVYFNQKRTDQQKSDYCHNLFLMVERSLDKLYENKAITNRQRIVKSDLRLSPKASRRDLFESDEPFQTELCDHFQPTSGRSFNLSDQESIGEFSPSSNQSKDALAELERWAVNPKSSRFFALLGEYGIGKTTTLKQLTQRLLERRKSNPSSPLPIYIDLRDYVSNEVNSETNVPTIEELLQVVIKRNRKLRDREITAEQLLDLVRNQGAVILFDGLDEKIVHMKQPQARLFIRCLWTAIPDLHLSKSIASKNRGKLLISCRSHYFRDVASQNSMLSGEGREGLQKQDFPAFCLLPFTEEQVLGYLESMLKSRTKAKEAFDLICSIHNLRDLAERPYLLSLIGDHLHEIELIQAKGEVVNAARLYDLFVNSWFGRDDGKHQLEPAHKRLLMERLAADLWNSGEKQWDADILENWLDQFLYDHPVIASAYANIPRVVLKEDLRTATFVVRPDTEEKRFRFAHTSLQEYFLAKHLVRGVSEQKLESWDCSMPSIETFSFVGQILQGEPQKRVIDSLNSILGGECVNAARNAFRYWLHAIHHDYLRPTPDHVNLAGADLQRWKIAGTKENRLNLHGANLAGAKLNESTLQYVDLQRATLSGAEVRDALFLQVNARGLQAQGVDFRGLKWRGGSISGADLNSASSGDRFGVASKFAGCQFIHVDADNVRFPEDWDQFGAILGSKRPRNFPNPERRSASLQLDLGHSCIVRSCSFSPDGLQLISGDSDGSVKLWDAESGACLRTFEGHSCIVRSCSFSPDGLRILSGGGDRSLRLWDAESGVCLRTFEGHSDGVNSCSFSLDGLRILSGGGDGSVKLWDTESGACLRTFEGYSTEVISCGFSPDGFQIISSGDHGSLKLWDTESGACLRTFEGHSSIVRSCSFSPDGLRILSGSDDRSLKLWDAKTGVCLRTFEGHFNWIESCSFSPDGLQILSGGSDRSLKLWDAKTGVCLRTFEGHFNWVQSCSFSPNGLQILSGGGEGSLRLWDAGSGACLRTFERHFNWVQSCSFSPDGLQILSGRANGSLQLWDAESGACLRTFESHSTEVISCSFNPDGLQILSGRADGSLQLWGAESGACLRTFEGHSTEVISCGFSPDGLRILCGGEDGSLILWDAESGVCLQTFEGHSDWVRSCSFSPDGLRILSGSDDGALKLWDAESGACLWTSEGHFSRILSCSFSPDGLRIIFGSDDGALKLWDAESGVCLQTIQQLPFAGYVTFDSTKDVQSCSENAWQYLGWRWKDDRTNSQRLLPAEIFGPLPVH